MNLIPFNLEAAKAGAKLITRDGRSARIGIWNLSSKYSLLGAVTDKDKRESLASWVVNGSYFLDGEESELDLFMAPEEISSNSKEQSQMTTITDVMIDSLSICDPAKSTLKDWFVGIELSKEKIQEKLYAHMHVNSDGFVSTSIGASIFVGETPVKLIEILLRRINFASLEWLVAHLEEQAKPKRNYSLDGANGTKKVELKELAGNIHLLIDGYFILELKDQEQVLERIGGLHFGPVKADEQFKAVIL